MQRRDTENSWTDTHGEDLNCRNDVRSQREQSRSLAGFIWISMWRIEGQVIEFVLLVDKRDRLICMALRDIALHGITWHCMA